MMGQPRYIEALKAIEIKETATALDVIESLSNLQCQAAVDGDRQRFDLNL